MLYIKVFYNLPLIAIGLITFAPFRYVHLNLINYGVKMDIIAIIFMDEISSK